MNTLKFYSKIPVPAQNLSHVWFLQCEPIYNFIKLIPCEIACFAHVLK